MYIYDIFGYIYNVGNKNIRRSSNNKILIDPNHKQETDLEEASATDRRKLGGYGITTTDGTVSIFLDGIYT